MNISKLFFSSVTQGLFIFSFLCIIFFFLISEKRGYEEISDKSENTLHFILDVSQSMQVRDINGKTRLQSAKEIIENLLYEFPGHTYSLFIFSGEAVQVLPSTNDKELFLTFLQPLDHTNLRVQGSRIDSGIKEVLNSYGEDSLGTIIILSDQDSYESESIEKNIPSIRNSLKEKNASMYIIGIGSTQGGYIIYDYDVFGQPLYKNYQGKRVISKLDEVYLRSFSSSIGASYKNYKNIGKLGNSGNIIQENKNQTYFFLLYIGFISWIFFLISFFRIPFFYLLGKK